MKFHDRPWNSNLTPIRKQDLSNEPIEQMERWFEEAVKADVPDINAMCLATASASAKPTCRMVLVKEFNQTGIIFFTNYESRKARQLSENPFAMGTIYWLRLLRQIGIEGAVEKTSEEESSAYFSQRPRGSQLGAWVSHQSDVIVSRAVLEEKLAMFSEKFKDKEVPRPPFWGGFRLVPSRFEFWQGGRDRLHDRFCYEKEGGGWKITRLAP